MHVYMGEDKTKESTTKTKPKNKYKVGDWFDNISSKVQDTGLSVQTGKGGFNVTGKQEHVSTSDTAKPNIMDTVKNNMPIVIGAGVLVVALFFLKK
jgi:hypothetical protein